jgi:hypothetical protein
VQLGGESSVKERESARTSCADDERGEAEIERAREEDSTNNSILISQRRGTCKAE